MQEPDRRVRYAWDDAPPKRREEGAEMTAAPQDDPLPLSGDTPAMLAEYLASGARLVEAFHQLPGVARAMREAAARLRQIAEAEPTHTYAETRENEMNNRELLELAAKVAGYKIAWEGGGATGWMAGGTWWNPLTDDGDALRLAVKLTMYVALDNEGGEVIACATEGNIVKEPCGGDPYAATRRAIVRAAAEIGKDTPRADTLM